MQVLYCFWKLLIPPPQRWPNSLGGIPPRFGTTALNSAYSLFEYYLNLTCTPTALTIPSYLTICNLTKGVSHMLTNTFQKCERKSHCFQPLLVRFKSRNSKTVTCMNATSWFHYKICFIVGKLFNWAAAIFFKHLYISHVIGSGGTRYVKSTFSARGANVNGHRLKWPVYESQGT